ncbi:MAG: dephospho-CoA kinase [Anaerolineae bacterium]
MKYIIGLTGNIGAGKSVVLEMLARLGAGTIDADALAHKVMRKGTPVWEAIVRAFGPEVLAPDGELDRAALGKIVFSDPSSLRRLEKIVHPAVIAETEILIQNAPQEVIAIEAIKLIESGMHRRCDALWVVTCKEEKRLERLVKKRGLSEDEALSRIRAQPPQEEKAALADVVIDNSGSFEETFRQVKAAWEKIPPLAET